MRLARRYVEKPWGRTSLPPAFAPPDGRCIGEVWFTGALDAALLAKYIFTSERLSIQVHPPQKTECWLVLETEPGATLGLGLTRDVAADELRAAALDGSIEQLVDWRPVRAGDAFLVPPVRSTPSAAACRCSNSSRMRTSPIACTTTAGRASFT